MQIKFEDSPTVVCTHVHVHVRVRVRVRVHVHVHAHLCVRVKQNELADEEMDTKYANRRLAKNNV